MCCSQLHLDTYTQKQEIWRENERDLPCSGRGGGGGAFIRSLTGSSSMPFTGGNALIESYCILGSFSWPLTRFLDFMPSSWKNPSKVSKYLPKRNFLFLVKNENKYDLLSSATGCAPVSPRRKRKQIKEIEAIITGCNWSDKKVLNETIFRIILETSTDWTLK